MKLNRGATCVLCGKWMGAGTDCVASKPKKGPEVYAHKACVRLRKERKK